jgi:7-cyano-7-deazaguanine synthase
MNFGGNNGGNKMDIQPVKEQSVGVTLMKPKELRKPKALIILSGGMDSTTLLYWAINQGYDCTTLSVDYGQKHKKELLFAKKTCKKLKVKNICIDLPILKKLPSALTDKRLTVPDGHYNDPIMKKTVVPNRNMILLSIAGAIAISEDIPNLGYGAHKGDHAIYPDCRKEFAEAMKGVLNLCHYTPLALLTPFIEMNKADIAQIGKELNVNYALTWSCYKGKKKPCGTCGTCIERKEAFEKVGLKDPLL